MGGMEHNICCKKLRRDLFLNKMMRSSTALSREKKLRRDIQFVDFSS